MIMNKVCNWVIATVKAIAHEVNMNIELHAPTHVGQAINKPVVAPTLLRPPPFLKKLNATTASAVFNPTRYDTMSWSTKLIGITCNPTCSVRYTVIFGMYPGSPQQGVRLADGTITL